MSSGSYVVIPPKPTFMDRAEEEIAKLKEEDRKAKELYDKAMAEVAEIRAIIASGINTTLSTVYRGISETLDGQVTAEHSKVHSGADFQELFFADVEERGEAIVFVAVDFSDALTIENATESAEYKKMAFTSAVTKRLMSLRITDSKLAEKVQELVDEMYRMINDPNISPDYFFRHISGKLEAIESSASVPFDVSEDQWLTYCSLCAMLNIHPSAATAAEVAQETERLKTQVYEKKYVDAAREALMETLRELGLEPTESYELDEVQGTLIEDKDNPDYKLFLSENGEDFALEMVQTTSQGNAENQASMCAKRRLVETKMAEKGFRIAVVAESDTTPAGAAALNTARHSHKSSKERTRSKLPGRRRKQLKMRTLGD